MQKLVTAGFALLLLFSCGPRDSEAQKQTDAGNELVDKMMACIASDWCKMKQDELYAAARTLDRILELQHLLGSKTGDDYLAFFSSHKKIFIPKTTPDFDIMVKLQGGGQSNGGKLAGCLSMMNGEQSEFAEDSPYYGFCKGIDVFMHSGIPDFEDFGKKVFSGVSKSDMNNDAALVLYYVLWGCQNIEFEGNPNYWLSNPNTPANRSKLRKDSALPPPPPPEKKEYVRVKELEDIIEEPTTNELPDSVLNPR